MKALSPMMSLLIQDIAFDAFYLRWTNCEAQVPRLPFKFLLTNHLVNPGGRVGLDIAQDVVQPMRCTQPDEQVNMILDSANCQRNAIDSVNNAAEIGMKVSAPVFCDQ